MRKLFALLMLMSLSLPVYANYVRGSFLLDSCKSLVQVSNALCGGFVLGVVDASRGKTWDGKLYCIPDEVRPGEIQTIILKWMEEHPEKLNLTASSLIQSALREAFPCTE